MPKQFYLLLFLSVLLLGCWNRDQNIASSSIGLYDISKDDQHILFSFVNNHNSSIYQINTDGSEFKEIISSTKDTNYFNPKYSKDGKRILFIVAPKNKVGISAIYTAEVNGTKKEKITEDTSIITEAFFSSCEDKIYFCKANSYGHYSPLGHDEPHDIDIYSVSLKNKKVERITNLKAYGIYRISEYDCQHILMFMPVEKLGGMILFSKDSSSKLVRINPANDPTNNPLTDLTMYYTPQYSKQYNMFAFIAPHMLYIMDMRNRKAKTVVDNTEHPQLDNFCFYNSQRKILYTNVDENNFNIVNFDGSGLKSIIIPIKNNSR